MQLLPVLSSPITLASYDVLHPKCTGRNWAKYLHVDVDHPGPYAAESTDFSPLSHAASRSYVAAQSFPALCGYLAAGSDPERGNRSKIWLTKCLFGDVDVLP